MGNAGFDYLLSLTVFLAWAQPGRLMMTIGYAALLVLLIQRHAAAPWVGRVAAAGRAAFSNYLGTSVVMTTIFYGYGLGRSEEHTSELQSLMRISYDVFCLK